MVSCINYVSELECALSYTNDFNVKLILLIVFLGYLFASVYMSKDWEPFNSTSTLLMYISFNITPKVFITLYPFFILLLRHSVSLDLLMTLLTLVYGIVTALFIGLSLMKGPIFIQDMFNGLSYKMKYMKR